MGHFKVYKDRAGGWRWRLLARNGKIIADSGEAYTSKAGCKRAIARLIELAQAGTEVRELR